MCTENLKYCKTKKNINYEMCTDIFDKARILYKKHNALQKERLNHCFAWA